MRNGFRLTFVTYSGMSDVPEVFEDRTAARTAAARRIRAARAEGRPVTIVRRGAEWEFETPDDAAMISDCEGISSIEPPQEIECSECGTDYAPEDLPRGALGGPTTRNVIGMCPDCANPPEDPAPDGFELSDFVDGAVKGLLFTAGLWDDRGRAPCGPGDSTDPADYFSADDVAELRSDCAGFLCGPGILEILRASGRSFEDAGADFIFTRNREGAGFWDGDWPKDGARALTDWAHSFGTFGVIRGTEEDPDGPAVRWNPDGTPSDVAESRFDPATDPARFSTHR